MNAVVPWPSPSAANPPRGSQARPALASPSAVWVTTFLGLHVALALLMRTAPGLATAHAFAVVVVGLAWAGLSHDSARAAAVAAYVTGSEVLWRMTGADVFWEYAKYAVAILFMFSLVRSGRWKPPFLALAYFILLLPSAVQTLAAEGPTEARQALGFNLSGPLALMVSVWFFSRARFTSEQLQRLLVILIGPIAGVAAIAIANTLEASSITFGRGSNFITSGGFGPNQVSASLGLAVLASSYFLLHDKVKKSIKAVMFMALIVFAAQSALTLSRGGLYSVAGAVILASPWLLKSGRLRSRLVLLVVLLFLSLNYVILPRLEAFTGGALVTRFRNLESTGRDRIIWADLQIWQENSLLGAGPGQAKAAREEFFESSAAHTEFSRLLAEHGVFGLGALMALLLIGLRIPWRARSTTERAFATMLVSWSFLFMAINAMRLVAPAFILGLASSGLSEGLRSRKRREGDPRPFASSQAQT